jgi:acetoin utilization protein AcuB
MLTAELINNNIPRLQLKDSIAKAMQLINDYRVTHLPVVGPDGKYLGLLGEDELLDIEEEKGSVQYFEGGLINASVKENEHFLNAVNCCNRYETSVVPVVNEDWWV